MEIVIALCSALLYFAALMQIIPGLSGPNQIPVHRVGMFAVGAMVLHSGLLAELILSGTGQNLSMLNVSSLVSLIISGTTTALMYRLRVWVLLPVMYSFSAINLGLATLVPGGFITHLETHPQQLVHISLALFAYAVLIIATLYAIQLAWLDQQLKKKNKLVMNPNLPPLMAVERQLFSIILIGQLLLTLTLASGFVFVQDMLATGKSHKTILSAMAWAVYGVLLWGHFRSGWRGKKVIWFSITGALLLTLAYFGSRFVREVIIAA
ncbi:chromosome partitioning protein ParB [Veronia nyctiphanis]|uniref:Chromosome partitioning protein ParB n=1 Tax=Veronia nyctiphanis TaxID=1278244 RepID=A0A4Q0YL14_9GAMM|nr:inner membrane protein YpjD [Veronia nyctiphanis]RXJ71065.1 chromosome partitioning protein ParB [Veronia nyctiphanis]